jgi:hypothetical protein
MVMGTMTHVRVEVRGATAPDERTPLLNDELLPRGLGLTDCGWQVAVVPAAVHFREPNWHPAPWRRVGVKEERTRCSHGSPQR